MNQGEQGACLTWDLTCSSTAQSFSSRAGNNDPRPQGARQRGPHRTRRRSRRHRQQKRSLDIKEIHAKGSREVACSEPRTPSPFILSSLSFAPSSNSSLTASEQAGTPPRQV